MEYTVPAVNRPGLRADVAASEGGRVSRVSRLMALAIKFERLVRQGLVRNYRDLAAAGQIAALPTKYRSFAMDYIDRGSAGSKLRDDIAVVLVNATMEAMRAEGWRFGAGVSV